MAGAVMGGVVWNLLDPGQQMIAQTMLGWAGVATVYLVFGRRLHADRVTGDAATRSEFAPTLSWLEGHQASWPQTREGRNTRRERWQAMNRQRAQVGRHRQVDDQDDARETVDREFEAAFTAAPVEPAAPVSKPQLVAATVRGKATVKQDLEGFLAAVRAVCLEPSPPPAVANTEDTALLSPVTSEAEPAR